MKYLLFLTFFLTLSCRLYAQEGQVSITQGSKYKLENKIQVNEWTGDTCDLTKTHTICMGNKIKVTGFYEDKAILKVRSEWFHPVHCQSTASRNVSYCVKKTTIERNIKLPTITPAIGLLTVPFRYEYKSSKIYAGGQLGGYLGIQSRLKAVPQGNDIFGILGATAGYSRIPLNNINATDPENVEEVGAFGFGGVAGITIGRFQAVFVVATDKYNIEDKELSRDWLSIGLGFGFIKPPSE